MSTYADGPYATPHAMQRAEERFAVRLTRQDVLEVGRQIEQSEATPMGLTLRLGDGGERRAYLLELPGAPGRACYVIYDRDRRLIVTFLDEAAWREQKARHKHNERVGRQARALHDGMRNGKRPDDRPVDLRRMPPPGGRTKR